MKLCFAFTGSFCNHARAYEVLREAVEGGSDVYPVFSYNVKNMSTRFGDAAEFARKVGALCGREIICDIAAAEQTVTAKKLRKSRIADSAGKMTNAEIKSAPTRFIANTMTTATTKASIRL